jgi:hypothetical protein
MADVPKPPSMTKEDVKSLAELLRRANEQAKGDAPYLRARREIAAFSDPRADATPAAKARALAVTFAAVADALDDTDPAFEPNRSRLREFVAVAGNAINAVKKKRDSLEVDHVLALLVEARERYRNEKDGFCTVPECLTSETTRVTAIATLAAGGLAVGAGVLLPATSPRAHAAPLGATPACDIGPGHLACAGRF